MRGEGKLHIWLKMVYNLIILLSHIFSKILQVLLDV